MMVKERSFTKTFFIFQFILSVYKNGRSSLRPGPFIVQISTNNEYFDYERSQTGRWRNERKSTIKALSSSDRRLRIL